MSANPITYTADKIFQGIKTEIFNFCAAGSDSFTWFNSEVWLSFPNPILENLLNCIPRFEGPAAVTHFAVLLLNEINELSKRNIQDSDLITIFTHAYVIQFFPHPDNDMNSRLIFSQIVTRPLFIDYSSVLYTSFKPFIDSTIPYCNYMSEIIDIINETLTIKNLTFYIRVMKATMITSKCLLVFLRRLKELISGKKPQLQQPLIVGISRILICFVTSHQKEYLKTFDQANPKEIKELLMFLKKSFNKNENEHYPILAFLLPFCMMRKSPPANEEIKEYSEIVKLIMKFDISKKGSPTFLAAYTLSVCFWLTKTVIVEALNDKFTELTSNVLSTFPNKKIIQRFPSYVSAFAAFEFTQTDDAALILCDEIFSENIFMISKYFDTSVLVSVFKERVKNHILSCITQLINIQEITEVNEENKFDAEELEKAKNNLTFTANTFYTPTTFQFLADCQQTKAIKYHDITETPNEICFLFNIFDNMQTIQHLVGLILQLFKTHPSRICKNLILLLRNIFGTYNVWITMLSHVSMQEISSFVLNISQNFLAGFTSMNKHIYDMKEHLLTNYSEFLVWVKVVVFDNICKDKEDSKPMFVPFVHNVADVLLVTNALFSTIAPTWFEKVDLINRDIIDFICPGQQIVPTENAWKELLKLPFKGEEPSIFSLIAVLPLLKFQSNAIDEFRMKYENTILSDSFRTIQYLRTAEKCIMPFAKELLQTLYKEMKKISAEMNYESLGKIMNIMIASSAIVSTPENAKIEFCGEMCIEFLKILLTDLQQQSYKTIAYNAFHFIEIVSHNLNNSIKRKIIMLLCDIIDVYIDGKTMNAVVVKSATKTFNELLKDFTFECEFDHIALYERYMRAREDCFFVLHVLRKIAAVIEKQKDDIETIVSNFSFVLSNNFLLCSDIFYNFLKNKNTPAIMSMALSVINIDLIKKFEPVVTDKQIQIPYFTFNFTDVLLEENANITYMNTAVDFVWCYGKQRDLLLYVINNSSEKTKSSFYPAYCRRCAMDMNIPNLLKTFEKQSIIDFTSCIHLNEEFIFFLNQFSSASARIGVFCSFFVIRLLGNPIFFGIDKVTDKNKAINFVDSLTKSLMFERHFEKEMQKNSPLIHTPDFKETTLEAIKILPQGRACNFDSHDFLGKVSEAINPSKVTELIELGILTRVSCKGNAWFIHLAKLGDKDIVYFSDFLMIHVGKQSSVSFVVDFEGASITDFEEMSRQIKKIWSAMKDRIDQIYTINLTKNAAGFINNFSTEEWTTKIVLIKNINDIFAVFPTLILSSSSIDDPIVETPVMVLNIHQATLKLDRDGVIVEADGNVLNVATKRRLLMRYDLINKIIITDDNGMEITYKEIDGYCQFSAQNSVALSQMIALKKAASKGRSKCPENINTKYSPPATIASAIELLDAPSHIVGVAAGNMFHRLAIKNQEIQFVGSKFAYPSQQWAIQHLWSSQYALESYFILCEWFLDKMEIDYLIGIGSKYINDQDFARFVFRLSRKGFREDIWAYIPPEKARIVLLSSVYCSDKFPTSIAAINVDAIKDYLDAPNVPDDIMEMAIKSIPNIIIESSNISVEFDAFAYALCLRKIFNGDDFNMYYALSEAVALKRNCKIPPMEKISSHDANDTNLLFISFREICKKFGCSDKLDAEFAGKTDALSILCRSIFDEDKNSVASDALKDIMNVKRQESGYIFNALRNILPSMPERANEFAEITIKLCSRDVKIGIELLEDCLRVDSSIAETKVINIVNVIQPFFINRLTVGYALSLIKVILETQKLSPQSSDIIHVPLLAFGPDDAVPFTLMPSQFAVKFLFKSLIIGQLSVKQSNRVLDYFISSIEELMPMKDEIREEVLLRLANESTLETGKRLTMLLRLLKN